MNTTGTNVKNGSPTSRAKDNTISPTMKTNNAGMLPRDEGKKQMMPPGQKDSTSAVKGFCGGVDSDGKPQHMTPCTCADKGAGQRATDKMSDNEDEREAQGDSVDYAAATMSAKDGATVPGSPRQGARHSHE